MRRDAWADRQLAGKLVDKRVRGGAPLAEDRPASRAALRPLESLNFFMADMQAGIGPFLGVFLLAHGWQSGLDRHGDDDRRRRRHADDRAGRRA